MTHFLKRYWLAELMGFKRDDSDENRTVWIKSGEAHIGIPRYDYYEYLLDAEREAGIKPEPQTFIERKRKRMWLKYWEEAKIDPLHAPLEARLDALIYVLEKLPL